MTEDALKSLDVNKHSFWTQEDLFPRDLRLINTFTLLCHSRDLLRGYSPSWISLKFFLLHLTTYDLLVYYFSWWGWTMNVVKLSLYKVKYALSTDFESRKGVSSGALNGNEVCTPGRHQLSTLKNLTKYTRPYCIEESKRLRSTRKWNGGYRGF